MSIQFGQFGGGEYSINFGVPYSTTPPPIETEEDIQGMPTPWGFLKNVGRELGEIVTGGVQLLTAAGHDIMKGVSELSPVDFWEDEGYKLAAIGRAFPEAMEQDYSRRYGSAGGFVKGLYTDPLAFLSDALIIAGGVGLAAKAGRVGGVMRKLPPVMTEQQAVKVLGGTKAEGYRATLELANIRHGPRMPTDKIPMPRNPLARYLLEESSKVFTVPADRVMFMEAMEQPELARAALIVNYAAHNGIRVLKPRPADFLTRQKTSHLLGQLNVDKRFITAEEVARIERHFAGVGDPELSGQYIRGVATSVDDAKYDKIPLDGGIDSDFLPATLIDEAPNAPVQLNKEFGAGGWIHNNLETPHSPRTLVGDPVHSTYTILTDNLDEIPRLRDRVVKALGLQDVRIRNYFADNDWDYDGYHISGISPDGGVVDVSFATEGLYNAQHAYGRLSSHSLKMGDRLLEVQQGLQKLLDELNESVSGEFASVQEVLELGGAGEKFGTRAQRLLDEQVSLNTELQATRELMEDMQRGHRLAYWNEHGRPVSPELLAAETARPLTWDIITKRWWDTQDMPATIYMERAYYEQRSAKFYEMMSDMREDLSRLVTGTVRENRKAAIVAFLDAQFDEALINEVVKGVNWNQSGEQLLKRLDLSIRDTLKPIMVWEGGRAVDWGTFTEYDWRVMRSARLEAGIPVPSYFHHTPVRKPSEYMMKSGKVQLKARTPGAAQHMKGVLLEEGRFVKDPTEALSRAAANWIAHDEMASNLEDLATVMGREITPDEFIDWKANQYSAEVLVPLDEVKGWLSLRGEILEDVLHNIPTSPDFDSAVKASLATLHERVVEGGLESIAHSRIVAMPRAVAREFERQLTAQFGHTMRIYWDGPMNLWKASVLSLSPRWVVNNLFGNTFFMGVENPGALRLAIEQMDSNKAYIVREMLKPVGLGKTERGFFSEAARYLSVIPDDATGLLAAAKKVANSRVGRKISALSEWIRTKNTLIEQAARRGTFLNEMQKNLLDDWVQGFHSSNQILTRAIREGDLTTVRLEAILKGVDKTLGNYTRYGAIEQGIIRRFLVPFWGFYRHAAKVLVRLPFEHPLKARVFQMIDQIDEQMEPLYPDWLRSRVNLADLGGEQLMLNLRNLNPLSQFSETQPVFGVLNPVAKMVIERQLGVDTFTGEPFRLPDNIIETWDGSIYEMQYDNNGNYTGVKQLEGKPLPDILSHLASQFPQLTLMPNFQRYPKSWPLQVASMLGLPLSQIDVEAIKQKQIESKMAAETTALNRLGAGEEGTVIRFGGF